MPADVAQSALLVPHGDAEGLTPTHQGIRLSSGYGAPVEGQRGGP